MTAETGVPFNPLDKTNLGLTVAKAMLERDPVQLPIETPFVGAGIYALYYVGNFGPYSPVAAKNANHQFSWPIYVGKAIPSGGRKGLVRKQSKRSKPSATLIGGPLFKRIEDHAESIKQASNLRITDFFCRYLAVDDIWIPLGESLLINELRPIWNLLIDGFGNHDPGGGRRVQARSSWDQIHPGRPWAEKQGVSKLTKKQILDNLGDFFQGRDHFETEEGDEDTEAA
jgi:hypothetical protein